LLYKAKSVQLCFQGNVGATSEVILMATPTKSRFPELLQLAVPAGTRAALDVRATKLHTTPTAAARQAILKDLEANGVQLVTEPERATE
jgi:hypothetical protein